MNGRTSDPRSGYQSIKRPRFWLFLILLTYSLVTVAYGIINPLFESPDEHWHFFTALYIAEKGELPAISPGEDYDQWMSQEAAQPPLYYLLGSFITRPADNSNARDEVRENKFAAIGEAGALVSKNRFIHMQNEAWPWTGYALSAHLLRGLSAILGLGTLLFIYASGLHLWPGDPYRSLLATGLVAFLPQFNFLHAAITNDALIIFLASAAIWQLIHLWRTKTSRGRLLLLGITVGLAALTKNAGILLFFYSLGFIILLAIRGSAQGENDAYGNNKDLSGSRLLINSLIFFILPVILLAGWLWLRNWMLYGDFMATNQFIRIAGGDRGYSLLQVLRESTGLWLSLIAIFGWFNLRAPDWIYWFWSIVVLIATGGFLIHVILQWRKRDSTAGTTNDNNSWMDRAVAVLQNDWVLSFLLAGWALLVYAGLLFFMMKTEAGQGRLLFPAVVPLALFLAFGWNALKFLRRISIILFPLALLTSIVSLLAIQTAYALPETYAELPANAVELDMAIAPGLNLTGVQISTKTLEPGGPLWMTLYWQREAVINEAPELVVSVFGRDFAEIGKLHAYHGRGLFPADTWPENEIIADQFGIVLDDEAKTPTVGRIHVSIVEGTGGGEVGVIKIVPAEWGLPPDTMLAHIGEAAALTRVEVGPNRDILPGETIDLVVDWLVLKSMEETYTTLVHLGQPDETPLAIGDQPPLNGDYPTEFWGSGEVINDRYELAIPIDITPGRYPVWIGMYHSETIERLPLTINGERQPNDVYLAGWVEIGE